MLLVRYASDFHIPLYTKSPGYTYTQSSLERIQIIFCIPLKKQSNFGGFLNYEIQHILYLEDMRLNASVTKNKVKN